MPVRNVYFLTPHQDDEVLFMAQVIVHHWLAGRGVRVVLMSNGSTSNVRAELNGLASDPTWWAGTHNPTAEGYSPLGAQRFGLSRTKEWSQALRLLGIAPEHQLFGMGLASSDLLPDLITPEYATEVMQYWMAHDLDAGLEAPGFYTMHWADPTADHEACGAALRTLRLSDPNFGDGRWLVKPEQAAALAAKPYVVPEQHRAEAALRQMHAAWAYGAWAPELGSFAIGFHSVFTQYFKNGPLLSAPNYIVKNP
jgi:LmbE family N-acetylglucosaminyl deacetylase